MSKAGDLLARMDRLGGATVPAPPVPPPALAPVPASANGRGRERRPVRFTVDLEPELHRSLRLFALERRTGATEVVRALLELLDDPHVAELVDGHLDRP